MLTVRWKINLTTDCEDMLKKKIVLDNELQNKRGDYSTLWGNIDNKNDSSPASEGIHPAIEG